MSLLSSDLRRAALELKLNQVKRATRSYLRDRTGQATGTLAGYAIAAGLYAASGIFLIAASLVGAAALFRWIEINYGMFWAFGAVGDVAAGDRRHLRGAGGQPASPSGAAFSLTDKPPARCHQGQSRQVRPDRGCRGRSRPSIAKRTSLPAVNAAAGKRATVAITAKSAPA